MPVAREKNAFLVDVRVNYISLVSWMHVEFKTVLHNTFQSIWQLPFTLYNYDIVCKW